MRVFRKPRLNEVDEPQPKEKPKIVKRRLNKRKVTPKNDE